MHSCGEWMKGKMALPAINRGDFNPQSCGSAVTYGRRCDNSIGHVFFPNDFQLKGRVVKS
jgi:hypothetical protein